MCGAIHIVPVAQYLCMRPTLTTLSSTLLTKSHSFHFAIGVRHLENNCTSQTWMNFL